MDSEKSVNEAFVGRMPALVASMILLAIHQAIIGARTNLPFRRVNIGNDRWSWSVEGRKFSVVKDGNAELASVINDQIRALRIDSERFARLLGDAPPSNMSKAAQDERAERRAEWTRQKRSLDYQIEKLQKEAETVVQRFEIDLAQVASRKPLFFFAEQVPGDNSLLLEYWDYAAELQDDEETEVSETVSQESTETTQSVPVEVDEQSGPLYDLEATPGMGGFLTEVEKPAEEKDPLDEVHAEGVASILAAASETADEDEPVKPPESGLSLSQLAEQEEAKEVGKGTPKGQAK